MNEKHANSGSWWSTDIGQVAQESGSSPVGLTSADAAARLQQYGKNALEGEDASRVVPLLWRQIRSPVVLILIAAAILSFAMHGATDGVIILLIVFASALLGFWQEFRAATAVASLQKLVAVQADVLRDGAVIQVALEEVVPGDVVILTAGSSIPADGRLLEVRDLFLNEATLTGETFPVEKAPGVLSADTPLAHRTNAVFQGTHVVSGVGRALVVRTGRDTQFGAIADRLRIRPEETDFELGVHQFGMLLIRVTLILVIVIFGLNVYLHRPVLDSLLFALALAVGLTPELLPAIISVNLARGARRMAARKVIVKRLVSIENFGSMNVLCSDKTGTLTEGKIKLDGALDAEGRTSVRTLTFAGLNAAFQTGFNNPIDAAIVAAAGPPASGFTRLDEIPYDFARKRLSVLTSMGAQTVMITKGALAQVLSVCTLVEMRNGEVVPIEDQIQTIHAQYAAFSARGVRTLGLAIKTLPAQMTMTREDEAGMTFVGFLLFADPPKAGIAGTVEELRELGIALKIITGDNPLVSQALAAQIGLARVKIVTGQALRQVSDDALPQLAHDTDIFAEVEPNQKERIIRALRKAGNVVGYMGDGINDAPALHAADVGLSVQGAADVAKQAADIVLLEPDLAVLADGVREGRRTFVNTQKYVFMATSANFGNMFSMAAATLFLPFLPMLPMQILLNNLLYDVSELPLPLDNVDEEDLARPRRWDMAFIRNFMLTIGPISSLFDFLTFYLLMAVLNANEMLFHTGWFVESIATQVLVIFVIRTRRNPLRSRPHPWLTLTSLGVVAAAMLLPFTPVAVWLGFTPLPPLFFGLLAGLILSYLLLVEAGKRWFYKRMMSA